VNFTLCTASTGQPWVFPLYPVGGRKNTFADSSVEKKNEKDVRFKLIQVEPAF